MFDIYNSIDDDKKLIRFYFDSMLKVVLKFILNSFVRDAILDYDSYRKQFIDEMVEELNKRLKSNQEITNND